MRLPKINAQTFAMRKETIMKKHVLPIVMLSLAVVMMNGCSLLLPAPKASDIHYNYDLKHYPHIVRQNTQQLYDDFKKETWIYGPKLGASGQYQLLRAWANSKKVVDSFIRSLYFGPRFLVYGTLAQTTKYVLTTGHDYGL